MKIKNLIKDISAAIIVTPVQSHYFYAKLFIKYKIPLIIEKPVTTNLNQLNQLIKISKNRLVLINHSDIYSKYFYKILDFTNRKKNKIENVEIKFFKHQQFLKKSKSDPAFEWLPHIVAVCVKLSRGKGVFKIIRSEKKLIGKNIYKKFQLEFYNKNFKMNIYYSNYPGIRTYRKVRVNLINNHSIIYDDSSTNKLVIKKNKKIRIIKDNSYSTLEELLNFFYKKIVNNQKINDLHFSKIVMGHVFTLVKKLN